VARLTCGTDSRGDRWARTDQLLAQEAGSWSNFIPSTVNRFNTGKGYGFISREGGEDFFVHRSEIRIEAWRVQFAVLRGPKGQQAASVEIL
jgi:cold shock protein